MKLRVPATYNGDIRDADGAQHIAVNGIVEIPEGKVTENMWGYGFARVVDVPVKLQSKD